MESNYQQNPLRISNLAEDDRPREKLINKGRAALSDAELIAILIGSGTRTMSAVELSKHILQNVQNNLNRLAKLEVKDLQKFKGIGQAKAVSIVAALELGRRRNFSEEIPAPKIRSSEDVYRLMRPRLLDLPHEEFWVILLNRANIVLREEKISAGGVSGTVADPKMIFKSALEHLASAIILVHNHPSGNLNPSEADLRMTERLSQGGKILDIQVLDHIIFANQGVYSFADNGRM